MVSNVLKFGAGGTESAYPVSNYYIGIPHMLA